MSRWSCVFASLTFVPALLIAQEQTSSPAPPASQAPAAPVVTQSSPPPSESYVIEDGGYSLEPIYWLNRQQPNLAGGAAATAYGDLGFGGLSKFAYGGVASMPAGTQNSLRFTYFRVQGNSNTILTQDATIFSEAYNTGDYLNYGYRLQSLKLSWDYLGYTWHRGESKIRLKTLYELQYDTISVSGYAPFKAVTTDSSTGNTDYNTANGSLNLIWPTFGMELEQKFANHFRWEAKASGFGLPHHAAIGDLEGSIAARVGQVEVFVGEKAYYFKTSPKGAEYISDTMSGAYVGVRYYWGRE